MLRLPKRMEETLILVYGRGRRESEVARELGISRQAINKFVREGRSRLAEIFIGVAEVLNADLVRVKLDRGCAVMRLRQTGIRAYAFYVPGKGPKVVLSAPLNCSGEARAMCNDVITAIKAWGLGEGCEGSEEEVIKCVLRRLEE